MMVLDSFSTYRLTRIALQDFLKELFPTVKDFNIKEVQGNYRFDIPRQLSSGERDDLEDRRWPDHNQ
jgi:hypothetical protein